MKKLILAIAIGLSGVSAFSQGVVIFNNSASSLVTLNGSATSGRVTLYYSTAATAPALPSIDNGFSFAGWTQTTPTTADIIGVPVSGRFAGGNQTADTAPGGTTPWMFVAAWGGTFSTFAEAVAANGNIGISSAWQQAVAATPNPPVAMNLGPGGFSGVALVPVPEPTTIALGVLGAGSLLFLRRKR